MENVNVCQHCGKPLDPKAAHGLCPECFMKVGLGAGTTADLTSDPSSPLKAPRFVPPTPEQLAPRFPHLEILGLIGQGGMGAVYKACQKQLDRLVALKILPAEVGHGPAFAERFTREARALAKLNHPNIVTVYDFGQTDGFYYFLMEFVDGATLRQVLADRALAPGEALAIVPQICEALQYAHDQGIVHRDIKPENILLDKKGRVKIADFGLAKLIGADSASRRLTQPCEVMGTPHYMAPEQIEKPQLVDHRADIYSLGVVFYEMLTGELPLGRFAAPSSHMRGMQVDVRLDEVVLRALEKEPELRYQQASQIKTDVETVAGIAAKLPPHLQAMYRSYEYRSQKTLWGLPLVHIAFGVDLKTGKALVAKGVIAIGNIAKGVVAFGGMAFGGVTFGGLSIGLFAVGGGALGLVAIGGAAIALVFAYGGGAVAPVAIGGGALGLFAMGGSAYGIHAIGGNVQDEIARSFFAAWAGHWLDWMMFIFIGVPMQVPLLIGIVIWLSKTESFFGSTQNQRKMRWSLLATGIATTAIWFFSMRSILDHNVWDQVLKPKTVLPSQPANASPAPLGTLGTYDWQKLQDNGKLLGGTPMKINGKTVLKIENTNDTPLQTPIFKIEEPLIGSATYAVLGEIKYENVQGNGYLEMWNYFPPLKPGLPPGQFFTRTLGEAGSGPMGIISGTSSWRPFSLPFDRTGTTNTPTRLEINLFLPGRGIVFVGPVQLVQF